MGRLKLHYEEEFWNSLCLFHQAFASAPMKLSKPWAPGAWVKWREETLGILQAMRSKAKQEYVAPLHRAIDERNDLTWFYALYDPGLAQIRESPRYPELVRRFEIRQ